METTTRLNKPTAIPVLASLVKNRIDGSEEKVGDNGHTTLQRDGRISVCHGLFD